MFLVWRIPIKNNFSPFRRATARCPFQILSKESHPSHTAYTSLRENRTAPSYEQFYGGFASGM